jgi:lipoate-protein ligase A
MESLRTVTRKVKGGKLVRLELRFEEDTVDLARLTGDFFIHPEEAIEPIEASIRACRKGEDEVAVRTRIQGAVDQSGATIIGFAVEDLASMFEEAAR